MIPTAIITFAKSKIGKATIIAFIILIVVLVFAGIIASKTIEINKKERVIKEQEDLIQFLELKKERLENELNYIKESRVLKDYYTNSSESVNKIEREKLTRMENETINKLSNDFYNFYISELSNENKIYKSSFVDSARKILYSSNIGQTRFNESVSRVGYEDKRVAALV